MSAVKGEQMDDFPTERLWTVEEIADRLNVHIVTVRRWIRSGRLAAMAFGGKTGYRVKDSDFQAFLQSTMTGDDRIKTAA